MAQQDVIYSFFPDSSHLDIFLMAISNHIVSKEYRDNIPSKAPEKIAHLITWGWKQDPNDRPTAEELVDNLKTPIEEISSKLKK